MPTINGTSVLGNSIVVGIPAQNLSFVAFYFGAPFVQGLVGISPGRLRFEVINASQFISVQDWRIEYPGIYPIYSRVTPFPAGFFVFRCFRPGLPYTLFYQ